MAAAARKVIVTCAITGSIHVPSQTPYLPIPPDQMTENAIGAANAGAAILQLHARNSETGQPTPDP
ncbi:MAG: 3-keto-5-aminohexanoate cleavage protein, partial [Chloroflexi bacterium]|nr:3-keto-5-aminohexanoate cleavage protein [Chloroflexota bacterium]